MAGKHWMLRFARWHIWLGWLVGVPILMWTITGLVMVSRPIDEVRGTNLQREQPAQPLPGFPVPLFNTLGSAREMPTVLATQMVDGAMITTATYADGRVERYSAAGKLLPPVTVSDARRIVAARIKGGDRISSIALFPADAPASDFRRPIAAWQVSLDDGTHVYVGESTGKIEAVRTRFWRVFDLMWGLHIMDLKDREDTSHPILIVFAALSVIGALLGTILMFRRRKARVVK